jgi:hypothetical protein
MRPTKVNREIITTLDYLLTCVKNQPQKLLSETSCLVGRFSLREDLGHRSSFPSVQGFFAPERINLKHVTIC